MKQDGKVRIFNFKFENWKNLTLFGVYLFYLAYFAIFVWKGAFPLTYGADYLAFWSTGKVADQAGYSEIYDLDQLEKVQTQEIKRLGFLEETSDISFSPIPAPVFSIFVLPFQLLSKVDLTISYWFFTAINLAMVIGYLVFFLKEVSPEDAASKRKRDSRSPSPG